MKKLINPLEWLFQHPPGTQTTTKKLVNLLESIHTQIAGCVKDFCGIATKADEKCLGHAGCEIMTVISKKVVDGATRLFPGVGGRGTEWM